MHNYSVSYVTINPLKCVLHFYIIFRSMKNCVLHTLTWDMFITYTLYVPMEKPIKFDAVKSG